jgi:hypothetical protein
MIPMKGSSSQPPELPEPEVEYRRPARVEPPAAVVPETVPVELILARTPQRAIGLTGIRAYPTGFGCTLHLRLREVIPGSRATQDLGRGRPSIQLRVATTAVSR